MPVRMVEVATRNIVEVPDAEVQQRFQSGHFAFEQGQKIPVLNAEGTPGTIDAKDFQKAVASKGYTLETAEQIHERQLQKEFGGIGGQAAAGAEAFARGATVGISDPLAIAGAKLLGGESTAEKVRKHLAGVKEANPITSTVGEIGGMLAPLLVSGGGAAPLEAAEGVRLAAGVAEAASTGAKALRTAEAGASVLGKGARAFGTGVEAFGAPTRGVALAGDLAERAMAAVVGDGAASTVGKMAQKALSRGFGDAVQGALIGAGNQLSEDALGNHELAADKMLGSIGHSALFGGVLGLATGSGGVLAKKATSSALEHVSPLLRKTAEEQAVKSLSYGGLAPKKLMRGVERLPGGIEGVGRELLDSGVVSHLDNPHTMLPKLEQVYDAAGAKLGSTLRQVDGKGAVLPDVGKISQRIIDDSEKVLGTLKELNRGGYAKVEDAVGSLQSYLKDKPLTLENLRDFRIELDKRIGQARFDLPPTSPTSDSLEALLSVRRSIEKTIEETVDKEGARLGLGKDLLDTYQADKLRFRRLAVAKDLAEDSVTRMNKNAGLSLTDKMLGAAEFAGSLAAGHPLAAAGSIAVMGASKLVRERGNATAASVLDKVADLASAQKTLKSFDSRIRTDMESFFDGKRAKRVSTPPLDYETTVKKVRAIDPKYVAQTTEDHLGSLRSSAPRVASAFQQTATRAALYLAQHLPKKDKPVTLQPQLPPAIKIEDPTERESFMRRVRATDDPASVIADLSHGELSFEAIDALKQVYPSLYADLKKQILQRAMDPNAKPLTDAQQIQLGVFFNQPLNDWSTPQFISAMQQTYVGPQGGGGAPPRPRRSGSTSNTFQKVIAQPVKLSGFGGSIK